MAWERGDVVLILFPYSDLNAVKTRPTIVVSGPAFQAVRRELLLVYLTSQISPHSDTDYVLVNWQAAGLLRPTLMKPRLATVQEALVRHHIGRFSLQDMIEVDRRLRRALSLNRPMLDELLAETNLLDHPAASVQHLAEAALSAMVGFAARGEPAVDLAPLRALMPPGADQ